MNQAFEPDSYTEIGGAAGDFALINLVFFLFWCIFVATMKETKQKKRKWLGRIFRYGIPALISVGLCWLLFTGIDVNEIVVIIREQCDFRWVAGALSLAVLSHICRAFRWGIQLKALGINAPALPLIYSIFGTYAVNLVLPRLGEIWRTGYIAQRQRAPFATVFGSMIADRLADTLTVLLMTLGTFLMARDEIGNFISRNRESYAWIGHLLGSPWLWGAAVAIGAALWWLMRARGRSGGWLQRFQKAMRELWDGFAVVATMPGKGRWLLLTVGIWGCYFLQMYISFFAFPFTREVLAHHGPIVALVTFVLASVSMGVPSNGGIGPWQWAVIFALGVYGVGRPEAASFGNLVLGANTLLLIVLGIVTFIGIAVDRHKQKSNVISTETQEYNKN